MSTKKQEPRTRTTGSGSRTRTRARARTRTPMLVLVPMALWRKAAGPKAKVLRGVEAPCLLWGSCAGAGATGIMSFGYDGWGVVECEWAHVRPRTEQPGFEQPAFVKRGRLLRSYATLREAASSLLPDAGAYRHIDNVSITDTDRGQSNNYMMLGGNNSRMFSASAADDTGITQSGEDNCVQYRDGAGVQIARDNAHQTMNVYAECRAVQVARCGAIQMMSVYADAIGLMHCSVGGEQFVSVMGRARVYVWGDVGTTVHVRMGVGTFHYRVEQLDIRAYKLWGYEKGVVHTGTIVGSGEIPAALRGMMESGKLVQKRGGLCG